MEAVYSSETLGTYPPIIWRHIPEDDDATLNCSDNPTGVSSDESTGSFRLKTAKNIGSNHVKF
jgi:hypothetical protein